MNKKLLIGATIATTLLISACVKKEAPKEEAETKGQEASQPAQFQNLSSVDNANNQSTEIPTQVTNETIQQNEHNVHNAQQGQAHATTPAAHLGNTETNKPVEPPKAEAVAPAAKVAEAAKPVVHANTTTKAQSEDDAVAAAVAAAAPALKN